MLGTTPQWSVTEPPGDAGDVRGGGGYRPILIAPILPFSGPLPPPAPTYSLEKERTTMERISIVVRKPVPPAAQEKKTGPKKKPVGKLFPPLRAGV